MTTTYKLADAVVKMSIRYGRSMHVIGLYHGMEGERARAKYELAERAAERQFAAIQRLTYALRNAGGAK